MLSAIDYTSENTITILHGATKQMTRSTCSTLKLRRENHASICSSVQIVEVTIKLTLTSAHSENTGSIGTGTTKNKSKFMKTGTNWFAQPWARLKHEFKEYQVFFLECSQEQSNHSYYSWNTFKIQHYIYSRTILNLYSWTYIHSIPSPIVMVKN